MTDSAPVAALADISRFRAFDTAAAAEADAAAPADFEESRRRLAALIDLLPQRAAIKDEDVGKWLERTYRSTVQRMELEHGDKATIGHVHSHVLWHVRRASGIGGSEISTVLKHYRGKRGTFGDAHNLVKEKLLMLAPQPSTDEMSRGIRAEPWIQKIVHETSGVKTDDASLRKLRGFRWDKRPAMVGTPDDILVDDGRQITLVAGDREVTDYKAPSAAVIEGYEKDGVSFDYVCQVHHYGIISMASGVKFNKMSIRALDPRSFSIMVFPVEFDVTLAKDLAGAATKLWNEHVMTGDIPVAPRPDDLDVLDDTLIRMGVEAAMLKVIAEDAKARHEDLRKRIGSAADEWHRLATGKMDIRVGSFSRSRKWDEDVLRDLAEQAGVDPAEFETNNPKALDEAAALAFLKDLHKTLEKGKDPARLLADFLAGGVPHARKLNADGLAERLEELDVSCVTAMGIKEGFLLTTKKSGPEMERLSRLRADASQMMDAIEGAVQQAAPAILVDEPEEDAMPDELTA